MAGPICPATAGKVIAANAKVSERRILAGMVVSPKAGSSAITAPTLVLWTSDDPTADVSAGRRISEMIPGARFEVMPDCGHWPQYEDPKTFNQLHIDFLLGRS